jgi:RNA polymerase sigma factor (sigma-70 family)
MNGRLTEAIRQLHTEDGPADADLLGAFVRSRDPAAFEALVHRHGPMVLGVCRRVLGHHDAEDAFQATFLVLARRVAAVVPRERLAGWLYGVAYRTALEGRRMTARRRAREAPLTESVHPAVEPGDPTADLPALLDRELSRLPDRLRLPVVLCDLEGRTRRQVARQLGIPDGTLSNRLAAARRLLAKRLAGRGVTLPAGGLVVFLAREGSSSVPASLLTAAVRAATVPPVASAAVSALTREVEKAMFLTKLKVLTAVVVAATLVTGVGVWDRPAATAQPKAKYPVPVAPKGPPPAKAEMSAEHKAVLDKAAEALKAVSASGDDAVFRKVNRLTTIGYEQARYGDKAGAAATFNEAIRVADGIKSEETKAEGLCNVGFYQAHGGLTADARKTAAAITLKSEPETADYRGRVLSEVAGALAAAGALAEAVRVAEAIPERVRKFQTKDGKAVERRDTDRRDYALKLMADAQVKAGDVAGAVATARKIKDEGRRSYRLGELVIEYGKAGDEAAARKLFEEVRTEMAASKVYEKPAQRNHTLAMLQAAVGDLAGALQWVEKIESPEERADALLGMSIGLAHRGQWKK